MSRVLPILFNGDMVRAIMDGRKTVTRRIIKPRPSENAKMAYIIAGCDCGKWYDTSKGISESYMWNPPCHAGDILYVRETWCKGRIDAGELPDGREELYISQCTGDNDFIQKEYALRNNIGIDDVVWHPSIHMPKEAARIWMKVKNVHVERLQDITDEQAKEEGANWKNGKNVGFEEKMRRSAVERFAEIWDSTVKKSDLERYGWDENPWVWVIEFERCEKPEGWCV